MDVWSIDQEDTVYDTEVQKKNTGNLPKRSRLYHGMINSKLLLPPGELDYNRMPDSYVIMIMPFDLMGRGLYRYTFEMICREIPELRLEDGATRIFLNTHGTVRGDADQELIDMLRYMECTTAKNAERSGSERIQGMHEIVENIRSSEEIGVRYMQDWEEKALERQEGRNAGLQEGADEQKKTIAKKLLKKGMKIETIAEVTSLSEEEIKQLEL